MIYMLGNRRINIPDSEIQKSMQKLEISREDAIQMYLEDEGFLENEEQVALTQKAENSGVAKEMRRCKSIRKTEKKRERKPDPTKEEIISNLAKFLQSQGVADVQIPNVGKLITFSLNGENFTLNLVRNRKKK